MEFMRGKFLLAQLVLLFIGILFYSIAYGAGVWWRIEPKPDYDVRLTLWEICAKYGSNDGCISLSGTDYMQSGMFLFVCLYSVSTQRCFDVHLTSITFCVNG